MKKKHINIILTLLSLCSYSAYSQINCTVPFPPVLTFVSVQPETGNTELNWILSPSSDIAAYVIYTFKDGIGMPIDTLWNPSATSYTFASTATKYFSVAYVIAAHRMPNCTSPLSNVLNTIFCSSEIDTCSKKIITKWNSYPDYPKHVLEYKIFVSVNGGPLSEKYSVDNATNTIAINDFEIDSQYCFEVSAVLEDGSFSNSNMSCLNTKMQRHPRWVNADQATIDSENNISISFTVDPLSEISHFRLERKSVKSGTFQEITQLVSVNGSVLFTDNTADINTVNYYRLSAINNCNIPVAISNLSSNLVLSLERSGSDLNLSWNSYKEWMGMVTSYRLFINTGNGFHEKTALQPTDTVFKLDYQEIMYDVTGDEICFYISALETSNPYGVTGESLSSRVCTVPEELITVPNVFTPNSGTVNAYFRPVLSFTPLDYHLVIIDRQGNILFETKDNLTAWDGSQNGNSQPPGVCLWFLKITMPSGKNISKTGTITILNNR